MLPEAVQAAHALATEGIAANVVVVTSPGRLFRELTASRRRRRQSIAAGDQPGHLETLFPYQERRLPMVTVHDASAHSLAFLAGAFGAPTVPLGVDQFGQSGSLQDLYHASGISVEDIVAAAFLALELAEPAGGAP